MASGLLIDYLGSGLIADRPAAPTLFVGSLGLWYATDVGSEQLSAWDGSVWADIAGGGGGGGGGVAWGAITGTLSAQTDLQTALNAKITSLADPNADRIFFWDDSAGAYAFLTVGANLSITGTTLDATGSGSSRNTVTALATSGSVAVDYALGDYFTLGLAGNATLESPTNMPGAGKGVTLMFRITQDSTPRTLGWPASFKWAGGVAGVVSTASGAIDVLAITSFDNGTTWDATLAKAFA